MRKFLMASMLALSITISSGYAEEVDMGRGQSTFEMSTFNYESATTVPVEVVIFHNVTANQDDVKSLADRLEVNLSDGIIAQLNNGTNTLNKLGAPNLDADYILNDITIEIDIIGRQDTNKPLSAFAYFLQARWTI